MINSRIKSSAVDVLRFASCHCVRHRLVGRYILYHTVVLKRKRVYIKYAYSLTGNRIVFAVHVACVIMHSYRGTRRVVTRKKRPN